MSPSSPSRRAARGLDRPHVVEVFCPRKDGNSFGSGYLVADGLVLTAGHVVSGRCDVRPLGGDEWSDAELVWRGESCDAALLRVGGLSARAPATFGRLATEDRAPCRALGFPLAQASAR